MKKLLKLIPAFLFMLISCEDPEMIPGPEQEKEPKPENATITLESGQALRFKFSHEGGSGEIRFSSTGAWKIETDDDSQSSSWLTVTPSSGKAGSAVVVLKADKNEGDERKVTIILSTDGFSHSFNVIQNAKDEEPANPEEPENPENPEDPENPENPEPPVIEKEYVVFDDDNFKQFCINSFDFDGDGGVSLEEAMTVSEMVISVTDGWMKSLKGLEAFQNLESLTSGLLEMAVLDLSGYVNLSTVDCTASESLKYVVTRNVEVTVNAAPETVVLAVDELLVTEHNVEVDAESIGFDLIVYSTDYVVVDQSPEWVSWIGLMKMDEYAYRFSFNVAENSETESRRGEIVFIGSKGAKSYVTVMQSEGEPVVKYTYLEFVDDAIKQYCIDNYDIDDDGEINLEIEALNVKEIKLEDETVVRSLADLVYFPNLEQIHLNGCYFTDVDLSRNPVLDSISLVNINGMSKLNLTSNQELTYLSIINSSSLAAIDISDNAELLNLTCRNLPSLTDLDVSQNRKLKELVCCDARLTTLDVSQNKALDILRITPMLSDKELEYLVVADDYQISSVSTLEISGSTKILVKDQVVLSHGYFELTASGSACDLAITTTVDYSIAAQPSWVVLDRTAKEDSYKDHLYFTVAPNEKREERQAELEVRNPAGKVLATIVFRQEAKEPEESEGSNQNIVEGEEIIL